MKEKIKNGISKHKYCLFIILVLFIGFSMSMICYFNEKNKFINPYQIKVGPMDNFVFLGDSITEYYPLEAYYDDLPVINSGISGDKTTDILPNMKKRVYQYNPTKVILLIGTNDLVVDTDKMEKEVIKHIKEMVNKMKKYRKKTSIYIESIYPVNKMMNEQVVGSRNNKRIKRVNQKIKELCQREGCTYIDMYPFLTDEKGNLNQKYTSDGLHLNSLGYVVVTRELLPYLNS